MHATDFNGLGPAALPDLVYDGGKAFVDAAEIPAFGSSGDGQTIARGVLA